MSLLSLRIHVASRFISNSRLQSSNAVTTRRASKLPQRTHILTLPLYNNAELWTKMQAFRDQLFKSDPPIEGLDPATILPRLNHSLQLRLGNLNIKGYQLPNARPAGEESNVPDTPAAEHADVLKVLHELKSPIDHILRADGGDGVLRVHLGHVRPLVRHGQRFDPRKTAVLLMAPTEGPPKEQLRAVATLVRDAFARAGMWIDAERPYTLNLTLVNTRNAPHRPPAGARKPFDLAALYASDAFRLIQARDAAAAPATDLAEPRAVDLGVAVVPGVYLERVGGAGAGERRDLPEDGALEFAVQSV